MQECGVWSRFHIQLRTVCKQCSALLPRGIVGGRVRHGIGEKRDPRQPLVSILLPIILTYTMLRFDRIGAPELVPFRRGSRWCICMSNVSKTVLGSPKMQAKPCFLARGSQEGHIRCAEELLKQNVHSSGHLGHEEKLAHAVKGGIAVPRPLNSLARAEVLRRRTIGRRVATLLGHGPACHEHRGARCRRGRS